MNATLSSTDVVSVLRARFGFDTLRAGQRQVIDRLLDGKSAVAIFPTGAGKSLCYQLPALMLDGLTLVVSPLIALMKDQIDFLASREIAAARLDSSVDAATAVETYRRMRDGSLKLLYVAPERLANERFLQTLSRLPIAMLAVDEAHCISEWGHNFRPDYLKLAAIARRLGIQRVLALTATATPPVADQIAGAFGIEERGIVRTGFYRPNLAIVVTPIAADRRDDWLIAQLKRRPPGPTIVYVTLQRTAEEVAARLVGAGFDASAYHAGMDADDRHRVQDHFMQSTGAIVVATIAFGMGIDKRDIRYVYHYNLPKTLENYAQEIGRAGRDGRSSVCELLASGDDRVVLENFVFGDTPEPSSVESIVREVLGHDQVFDLSVSDLASRTDVRPLVVETLLTYLQLDGVLESTGAFYDTYKLRWRRDPRQALAQFDRSRAEFLREVLACGRTGKTWVTLDVGAAAARTGQDRQRVVAALTYLDEQGEIELEAAGVRHGFRRLKSGGDAVALARTIAERFQQRERRDLDRLQSVLDFCSTDGCMTRKLLAYFGETLDADCGHCGACRAARDGGSATRSPGAALPQTVVRPSVGEIKALARALRQVQPDAFAAARPLARFLCGISSPALVRARLTRDARFGRYADVPFRDVLATVEAGWGDSSPPTGARPSGPVSRSASSTARRASAGASSPAYRRGSSASSRRG